MLTHQDENKNTENKSQKEDQQTPKSVSNVMEAASLPPGYQEYVISNVMQTSDLDEKTDFASGVDRPQELISFSPGVLLVANIDFQFSFKKREQKTESDYAKL